MLCCLKNNQNLNQTQNSIISSANWEICVSQQQGQYNLTENNNNSKK